MKQKLLSLKERRKLAEKFQQENGACRIDLKNRDVILYDGGLFSIQKYLTRRSQHRIKRVKEGRFKDCYGFVAIKGKKVKYEEYEATFWFEELRETIIYLQRLEKVLIKMGYNTHARFETKFVEKLKEI